MSVHAIKRRVQKSEYIRYVQGVCTRVRSIILSCVVWQAEIDCIVKSDNHAIVSKTLGLEFITIIISLEREVRVLYTKGDSSKPSQALSESAPACGR